MKKVKNNLNKNSKQDTPAPNFVKPKTTSKKINQNKKQQILVNKNLASTEGFISDKADTPTQYKNVGEIEPGNSTTKNENFGVEAKPSLKITASEGINSQKSQNLVLKNNKNIINENDLDNQTVNLENSSTKTKPDKAKKERRKTSKAKKPKAWVWLMKVFVLAVALSLSFSILSEMALSHANIVLSVVVILVFIAVSIVFDMLGLAVASCPIEPFTAMAARKVAGSKLAISLIKNADKVSAICCDVIGDVCGILAGAGGASILTKIAISSSGFMPIFVASLISAIIAGLTIGGKASFKRLARAKSSPITLKFAQVLNLFVHKK